MNPSSPNFNEMEALQEEWVRRYVSSEPFQPTAYYDDDGDCIEVLISNDLFVEDRIDRWLTVYRHREGGEIVGSFIKDVSKLIEEYPLVRVYVEEGEVAIDHILIGPGSAYRTDPDRMHIYRFLIEKARTHNLRTHLAAAAL